MQPSELAKAATRHDPGSWTRTLAYRPRHALPFDVSAVPPGAPLLFDTTVYIDTLKNAVHRDILALIASRPILHAGPALAEFSLAIGLLDPLDPRTASVTATIRGVLDRISLLRVVMPAATAWVEAAILTGILARTQGIARTDRRKLLNDALLLLTALQENAVLLTRNFRDIDLLLQLKPEAGVLFYG